MATRSRTLLLLLLLGAAAGRPQGAKDTLAKVHFEISKQNWEQAAQLLANVEKAGGCKPAGCLATHARTCDRARPGPLAFLLGPRPARRRSTTPGKLLPPARILVWMRLTTTSWEPFSIAGPKGKKSCFNLPRRRSAKPIQSTPAVPRTSATISPRCSRSWAATTRPKRS